MNRYRLKTYTISQKPTAEDIHAMWKNVADKISIEMWNFFSHSRFSPQQTFLHTQKIVILWQFMPSDAFYIQINYGDMDKKRLGVNCVSSVKLMKFLRSKTVWRVKILTKFVGVVNKRKCVKILNKRKKNLQRFIIIIIIGNTHVLIVHKLQEILRIPKSLFYYLSRLNIKSMLEGWWIALKGWNLSDDWHDVGCLEWEYERCFRIHSTVIF